MWRFRRVGVRKITEELDYLQKKVASIREIYKLYPDTLVKSQSNQEDMYSSDSINKDVDIVRFSMEKAWVVAYTCKRIGCIEVFSTPEKFYLLIYHPGELFKQLVIQDYHYNMRKHSIPDSIIRDCDLRVISFIKERNVDLSRTNLKDVNPETSIGKLVSLL